MSYDDKGFEAIETMLRDLPQTDSVRHLIGATMFMRKDMQKNLENLKTKVHDLRIKSNEVDLALKRTQYKLAEMAAAASEVLKTSTEISPELEKLQVIVDRYNSPAFK